MNHSDTNTILIVDDEQFNLDILEYSLEEFENFILIRANNGVVALETVHSKKIDLIILDVSMPEMDGLEVLQKLKAQEITKYIPVIMVTAKTEEKHKALTYGAEDFLLKPIDVIELKLKVQNLLKLKNFNDLQLHFNQRLEEEISKKEQQLLAFAQIEQELALAKNIQQSILPKENPSTEIFNVYGSCTQAHEVGGDYYDVFQTNCKQYTIFVIADVSGHGIASSLVAMQFRTLIHAELRWATDSLSDRVNTINTILSEDSHTSSMFITALILRFNHKTHILESVNAGHHNPIGSTIIDHQSGIPLGIMSDVFYQTSKTELKKGDTLLLFTDGILEELNAKGEMYEEGFYQSYETVKSLDSKSQIEVLLKDFYQFIETQHDDVTLLAIKIN